MSNVTLYEVVMVDRVGIGRRVIRKNLSLERARKYKNDDMKANPKGKKYVLIYQKQ